MTTWKTATPADRKLAAALHRIESPCRTFDTGAAAAALTWIGRLDAATQTNGREAAAALVNHDWMRPMAEKDYDAVPQVPGFINRDRLKADAAFAAWHASRAGTSLTGAAA